MIGVYMIQNVKTNKVYIGVTNNTKQRISAHKSELRRGTHRNSNLQKEWTDGCEEDFIFAILDTFTEVTDENFAREVYWIEFFKSKNYGVHNLTDGGKGSNGFRHDENSKRKMAIAKLGNKNSLGHRCSEETKEKLRRANTGDNNPRYWLGKHRSDEQKKKHSEFMKGRYVGEKSSMFGKPSYWKGKKLPRYIVEKVAEANRGRKHTDEARKNMSLAHIGNEPSNKFTTTPELIEEIKNGMTYKEFVEKYRKTTNVIKRIKRELKEQGII